MPPLNWDAFAQLPGSPQYNFEQLCRGLIRRHYEQYGDFAALAAQPGVEFHLRLKLPCSLGSVGRWYGWQCRWYELPRDHVLGTTRRKKIKEAIWKTEQELPNITDWVLWTRHTLTRADQQWISTIGTHMTVHLWTVAEVDEHLSGEAEILRHTYFGDLVLLPGVLSELHEQSIAQIRWRWQPDLHQTINAERNLRRILGESNPWDDLNRLGDALVTGAAAITHNSSDLAKTLADEVGELAAFARATAERLKKAYFALDHVDLDLLHQVLGALPITPQLASLPRRLRARRHHTAPSVTNVYADIRRAGELLRELGDCVGVRMIAVLGEAGRGKTELAAQLTMPGPDRPAGILIHGISLDSGANLDDLAKQVTINGVPVASMEALVAAIDAAGQRARKRLPIVFDGLNEAGDPRDWHQPLSALKIKLRRYPNVLVVCLLRDTFADEALPDDIRRLSIPGFEEDTVEAVQRYFQHYRINATDVDLPWEMLREPLLLRLFCEVTNHTRQHEVGAEAIPGSLTNLFDRYIKQASERINTLAPRNWRLYEQDVLSALDTIGLMLWDRASRSVDLVELRNRLDDTARPWKLSIVAALEQEGILQRIPEKIPGNARVTGINDALAGHIIAGTLLARYGRTEIAAWFQEPRTVASFAGPRNEQHPLASDILEAMVGLIPKTHRQQLWPLLTEPLRTTALRLAAELDGASLDSETVSALARLVILPPVAGRDLLKRLQDTRGAVSHPLNADFLDSILRPMGVAERDMRWTEWVRLGADELVNDLQWLEKLWRSTSNQKPDQSGSDVLRARWVMWTLASTVRALRDQATRTLYWFGRRNPVALFKLAIDSLTLNDAYIPERVIAAAFGVAMAHQLPDSQFSAALANFLGELSQALIGSDAVSPTNHWLIRLHAQGVLALATKFHQSALPENLRDSAPFLFVPGPSIESLYTPDHRAVEATRTLQMDFENYTLGRLFNDRGNYDMKHSGHQAAVAYVLGTVWSLGWREGGLGRIDNDIVSYRSRGNRADTERYGKKYGWTGYYEYAGILQNQKRAFRRGERLSDIQIDPSFPETPPPAPFPLSEWASATPENDKDWLTSGTVTIPDELLFRSDIGGTQGPWLLAKAFLETDQQHPGRNVFGFISAMLVKDTEVDHLVRILNSSAPRNSVRHPEESSDHYTFAGEIPWSMEFARNEDYDDIRQQYYHNIYVDKTLTVEAEILAHRYAWESYHSNLNNIGGALTPSRSFSEMFDLRGQPQSFNQTSADGIVAAISLSGPVGFKGDLLYLRKDLVDQYVGKRKLIWHCWGERQLYPYVRREQEWVIAVRRKGGDVWRTVRLGDKLTHPNSNRRKPPTRRVKAGR